MKEKKRNIRGIVTVCLILSFFTAFGAILFNMQVISAEKYAAADNSSSKKPVAIEAARGEILDRNGIPLITNRQGNSIIFESSFFPRAAEPKERAKIIAGLIKLFEENNEPWIDNLPLVFDQDGNIAPSQNRESDIAKMKSKDMLNLQDYASADDCFNALIKEYSLEEYYNQDIILARKIASVCYEMKRLVFSVSSPYTFAEDVSDKMVAKIKENSGFYKGVESQIVTYREYTDGTLAPHILGRAAAISADEFNLLQSKGYKLNDTIGKEGIERAMEDYLRGTDGVKTFITDNEGKTTTVITKEPVQGNTVVLTIDSKLQRVAQDALKEQLLKIRTILPPAGAVVVIDCKTGEVLASASYPTYDISTYSKSFTELVNESGSPLMNRALNGLYVAGSTLKPSVAIAALETGLITKSSTRSCNHVFDYNNGKYYCLGSHGNISVVQALKVSCNIFFYKLGDELGITKVNDYRTLLGLGQKTGIELDEAAGNLDSPEYEKANGGTWLPGYTIQSAIGQAKNLFTPIQLANYCATIANGGTRYQAHFVKSVKTFDFSSTVLQKQPVVACETGFSENNLSIVREGMFLVGTEGAGQTAFAKLPVKAAAKTGTAQLDVTVNGGKISTNNCFLISYAPAEKPEIAVCVAAEGFNHSVDTTPIAAKIYEYYFSENSDSEPPQAENTLLG